jgi:hypothetical protein
MAEQRDVPPALVDVLRSICLALPEAHEEQAWVGTRWCIRKPTFAHVLAIDETWPPAYARAANAAGPLVVLTFKSSGEELDVLRDHGRPFFAPQWRSDEVGLELDERTDWDEVRELLTESYCIVAPKKLAARVERPGEPE